MEFPVYFLTQNRLEMAKLPDVVGLVDAGLSIEAPNIFWMNSRDYTGHLAPYLILNPLLPFKAVNPVAVQDVVLEAPGMRKVASV
jgi:hypothetical protein